MRTISELAKDIKEIYEEVLILQNSMEKKDIDIDFQKINAVASKNPIENHYIGNLDEYTQKVYFTYLCKVINFTNDDSTKYSQIQFMSRIISGIKNPHFDIKEILLSSISNQMDLGEFVKCISDELLDVFIVDNLILAYINGNGENQVIDYVSEIISLFKLENEKFKELASLARAVLNKDDDAIVEYSRSSDLNKFLCYMKNPYEGVVVYSLEDAKIEKSDSITILNVNIENLNKEINLDEFHASEITFRNSEFRNIKGVKSTQKVVKFYNCIFENCTVSKELVCIDEGMISKSIFRNCVGVSVKSGTYLISLQNGNIENLDINDCCIETEITKNVFETMITGLVKVVNGNTMNCCITGSKVIGGKSNQSFVSYNLHILNVNNGKIERCIFKECACIVKNENCYTTVRNYIIKLLNAYEKECEFINCISQDYDHRKSNIKNNYIGNQNYD